jgi:hypothetical protein
MLGGPPSNCIVVDPIWLPVRRCAAASREPAGSNARVVSVGEKSITPQSLETLCDNLLENPGPYLDEMAVSVSSWNEF